MKKFMPKVLVQKKDFDVNYENQKLIINNSGAIVNFVGTVRGFINKNEKLTSLTLEHYPEMTENEILKIIFESSKKWEIEAATVIHRVGTLLPSDKIVYVGVSSKHRQNSFNACNFIIDWLKTRAPFWKSEKLGTQSKWVKTRDSDQEALNKWI